MDKDLGFRVRAYCITSRKLSSCDPTLAPMIITVPTHPTGPHLGVRIYRLRLRLKALMFKV